MRFEIKYLLSSEQKRVLIREWGGLIEPNRIYPRYPVSSIYYDTIDLSCLKEKEEGFENRHKYRFRVYAYDFTGIKQGTLELKERKSNKISKKSISLSIDSISRCLYSNDWTDIDQIDSSQTFIALHTGRALVPAVKISYMREAYAGVWDSHLRINFDYFLSAFLPLAPLPSDYHLCPMSLMIPATQEILEVKAAETLPEWFFNTVRRHELQQWSLSKYGLGIKFLNNGGYAL